ncbi:MULTISPECIES: hypothetical protein [Aquincola]|uniref:hypothetical protein n=1 Tax=Aquincola TaxID=391952 RepID=UPI0012EE9B74|nr:MULTISPECIES: hypothetical protein [Aquincola]MCR5867111.1 hypothetical protein [Aquincola sp. J276]
MSGALKSVFGGGNIFGSLLSLASLAFPPLAIAGSMSNLLTQAIGTAVKMAADTLMKEFGMPKFVRDIVNTVVDGAVSGNTTDSDPEVDNFVEQQAGAEVQQFAQESSQAIVQRAMAKMRSEGLENSDENRSKARGSSRAGSGSWLEAIAAAMGEVLGEKASKMVELSNKIASTAGEEGKSAAKANAAATTEMQATSQMFSLMQNGFSNTIKAIGEGLSQMARKG